MCRATLKSSRSADVVIMSAAVADYTPEKTAATKLKKAKQGMILRLKPTVDILRELGRRKGAARKPILIGFALETGSGSKASARRRSRLSEALRKLRDKNLDAIVLDTPAEMAADSGNFTVLLRDGRRADYRGLTKAQFAKVLIGLAERFCGC
jgi:phosphopantothenoylcysteine decarboxylase/phosphopantothenate--cysteine ligase